MFAVAGTQHAQKCCLSSQPHSYVTSFLGIGGVGGDGITQPYQMMRRREREEPRLYNGQIRVFISRIDLGLGDGVVL